VDKKFKVQSAAFQQFMIRNFSNQSNSEQTAEAG